MIVSALKDRYHLVFDSQCPEYLFYSAFGMQHFRYEDAIKIYFSGENDVPDFNICDYGIASSRLDFGDRYFRFPLYALYQGYDDIIKDDRTTVSKDTSLKLCQRKFCNFVYSHYKSSDPFRDAFYHKLSQYKRIDSGGKHLNNIGQPVANKISFLKDYKFTIAFENSSLSGYTTEKLLDPMRVNSMPIYWGNPDVAKDFNLNSFINVMDYPTIENAIEDIIYLDNNDTAYLEKLFQPRIIDSEIRNYQSDLSLFLQKIMEKSLPEAKKTTKFGYAAHHRKKILLGNILLKKRITRIILKRIILPHYRRTANKR
jgi:hypothetical protein